MIRLIIHSHGCVGEARNRGKMGRETKFYENLHIFFFLPKFNFLFVYRIFSTIYLEWPKVREDISQPFIESSSPRITYYQAKLNFHDFSSFLFHFFCFIGVMLLVFFRFLHRKKESKCRQKVRQSEFVTFKKIDKKKISFQKLNYYNSEYNFLQLVMASFIIFFWFFISGPICAI